MLSVDAPHAHLAEPRRLLQPEAVGGAAALSDGCRELHAGVGRRAGERVWTHIGTSHIWESVDRRRPRRRSTHHTCKRVLPMAAPPP
eukprot:260192-Chlamydomonas_euryale.AAC.1